MIRALSTSVPIKLVFLLFGPNESQRKYCPVNVGFLLKRFGLHLQHNIFVGIDSDQKVEKQFNRFQQLF